MAFKVIAKLNPELLDQLRYNNLEFQYAYTQHQPGNNPRSLCIRVECVGISLSDLDSLSPWGNFIVCPCNKQALELFTALPDDITKCIIE